MSGCPLEVREQLKKKLAESGFTPDSPAATCNADNDDFARCVLTAGLFPNVARVVRAENTASGRRGGGGGSGVRVCNNRGLEVAVHPSSVNGVGAVM